MKTGDAKLLICLDQDMKTCAAALAPKNIRAAVQSVADKEDRSKNLKLYGIDEAENEALSDKFSEVISLLPSRRKTSNQG